MFITCCDIILAIIHNKGAAFNSKYVSQIQFQPTSTSGIAETTKAY